MFFAFGWNKTCLYIWYVCPVGRACFSLPDLWEPFESRQETEGGRLGRLRLWWKRWTWPTHGSTNAKPDTWHCFSSQFFEQNMFFIFVYLVFVLWHVFCCGKGFFQLLRWLVKPAPQRMPHPTTFDGLWNWASNLLLRFEQLDRCQTVIFSFLGIGDCLEWSQENHLESRSSNPNNLGASSAQRRCVPDLRTSKCILICGSLELTLQPLLCSSWQGQYGEGNPAIQNVFFGGMCNYNKNINVCMNF